MNRPTPHPLKEVFRKAGVKQLDLVRHTGIQQSTLSLMLSGWKPMAPEVEDKLKKLARQIKGRD